MTAAAERSDGPDRPADDAELEDRTLMEEIVLLGAVIEAVSDRPGHLTDAEVDSLLEHR